MSYSELSNLHHSAIEMGRQVKMVRKKIQVIFSKCQNVFCDDNNFSVIGSNLIRNMCQFIATFKITIRKVVTDDVAIRFQKFAKESVKNNCAIFNKVIDEW